ncbi:TPR-like protein [Cystobasidium minutum MCA 4210]|uniref:TPR-like protein n=1 Tax=Cystobasidium minutum MCA 4210 TaxID=1397322 RepID=UPI0034CF4D74|eukprot:jgi/Rhomi1/207287/estExt_Genemark1.C_1_t10171
MRECLASTFFALPPTRARRAICAIKNKASQSSHSFIGLSHEAADLILGATLQKSMIALQWMPPWRQLTAACKHSRSIIKGKAPENCICQRIPARNASVWTQLAFAGGEGPAPSASTSTSIPPTPGIGFLFFYPSFHFDIPHVKSRHIKLIKRALRKSFGLSRTLLLPTASTSTSHQARSHESTPPTRRHFSHTAAIYSASPSQEEYNSQIDPSDPTALSPSPPIRRPPSIQSRTQTPNSDAARIPRQVSDTTEGNAVERSHPTSSTLAPNRAKAAREKQRIQNVARSQKRAATELFDTLVTRTYDSIKSRAELKRIRWRLYALLRIFSTKYELRNLRTSELRILVERVCAMHEPTNDSRSIEEIIRRAETLSRRFHAPTVPQRAYYHLHRTYTRSLRAKEAFRLLRKVQAMNFRVDKSFYLNLITMYAHLKDPEKAREIIERMRQEDIHVNQKAFASLMNAYVEAGMWDEAIDIFEYLDSHPQGHSLKPDLYTCTTLMKCYILMGAPLDEVIKILNAIQRRGMTPSSKTYTQALHAACEAGALDFAEEIFVRLDEEGDSRGANVVAFSVMIRGMLRAGRHDVANEYYQEMRRRGLTPTSATWSILLQAYAAAGKPETTAILTDLLKQYLDIYLDTRTGNVRPTRYQDDRSVARGTALENVYGPVISSLAKGSASTRPVGQLSGDPDTSPAPTSEQAAVDMFKNMLDYPGSRPSLHLYTALLDAYRRVGDTTGVDLLWESIIEFAKKTLESLANRVFGGEGTNKAIPASKRNLLCLPLSIYMDAMSRHHLHRKVADAWASLQEMGFGFDVGNWNHLIAAFIRAGDLDRAIWISEELLRDAENFRVNRRPRRDGQGAVNSAEQLEDSSSATSIEPGHSTVLEGDKAETPMRPPNRTWQLHRNRKEEIYARQDNLVLDIQDAHPSHRKHQPASFKQPSPDGPSLALAQHTLADSMTASYDILRQQHHAQTWVLFSSTVSMLDEALRQESDRNTQRADQIQHSDNRTSSRTEQESRSRDSPRTMATIEQYRHKLRRYGLLRSILR